MSLEREQRRWRAMDPDHRYGLRLTLALGATFLVAVPFLLLLLLVRAKWGPLLRVDVGVADELHELSLRHPSLVRTLELVSTIFDPMVFRVTATLLAGWLLYTRRPRLASWLLVTTWGAALLGVAMKDVVRRTRPYFEDAVAHAPGKSFPSGHALGSMVGCGVLLLVLLPLLGSGWRRLAWVAAALIVAAVGFARVGLGVHYFSDVIAGWVLGLAWLAATIAAFRAWRREVGGRETAPSQEGLEPELAEDRSVRGERRG